MSENSLLRKHYCEDCGDRIFRRGFKINNKLYCKRCVYKEFGIRFGDYEYTLPEKEDNQDQN